MRKIVEYTMVLNGDEKDFLKAVNALLEQKWQPPGSLRAVADSYGGKFYQAMVKYEEPAPAVQKGKK